MSLSFVDYCRFGRVNFILALRLELLKEVERLQVTYCNTLTFLKSKFAINFDFTQKLQLAFGGI